ncbi:hypothetical protein GQ457_07G033180 [Hibiscus cannabinus]
MTVWFAAFYVLHSLASKAPLIMLYYHYCFQFSREILDLDLVENCSEQKGEWVPYLCLLSYPGCLGIGAECKWGQVRHLVFGILVLFFGYPFSLLQKLCISGPSSTSLFCGGMLINYRCLIIASSVGKRGNQG